MTTVSTTPPVAPDWTLIEADYRAGIKSVRTIAEEHGISHTAINKRAKRDGWTRDLSHKIRAAADALVSKEPVSSLVSAATEREVVAVNATLQYQVRMAHRADIARGRKLWDKLAGELEASSLDAEQFEALLALQKPEGKPQTPRQAEKAREALARLASAPGRIGSASTLVSMLERLVKLERQAFGIEGGEEGGGDNPQSPAGAAAGSGRGLSDAERAIRLARMFKLQPQLVESLVPAA